MARIRPPVEREVENGKFISTVKILIQDVSQSWRKKNLFIWLPKSRNIRLFKNIIIFGWLRKL